MSFFIFFLFYLFIFFIFFFLGGGGGGVMVVLWQDTCLPPLRSEFKSRPDLMWETGSSLPFTGSLQ